jgi:hypothetical protein
MLQFAKRVSPSKQQKEKIRAFSAFFRVVRKPSVSVASRSDL